MDVILQRKVLYPYFSLNSAYNITTSSYLQKKRKLSHDFEKALFYRNYKFGNNLILYEFIEVVPSLSKSFALA